ncbi:LexA family protein [Cytobacillus sp. Hm23]
MNKKEKKKLEFEQKVLKAIEKYLKLYNTTPSIREIRRMTEIKSLSTVYDALKRLQEKGVVNWEPKRHKTIELLNK